MKAKLKHWYCPDIEDLRSYFPEEPDNFCFLFRSMVGPEEREGEESFDIQVCTPKWLLFHMKKDDVICGRHFLIAVEYDFERIFNRIKFLIESCYGKHWEDVAGKVSRIGFWEFEDYQEFSNDKF